MNNQVVYGIHAVQAVLKNSLRPVLELYLSNQRQDSKLSALAELAKQRDIPVHYVDPQTLNRNHPGITHQGVTAKVKPLPEYHEKDLSLLLDRCQPPYFILILDGVTDPHNLGACLRTADAAGVQLVLIPKDKNAGINAVVSKVACGAAETVPVVKVTNLVRAMEVLKEQGIWIYGAAGEAEQSIYQLDGRANIALVMGAEGSGLRRLTREHCDGLFALPMAGQVESLNVSVAAGISLYEIVRQRNKE